MLTDHDKQATGNREPANEMNKEDPTQGILISYSPSQEDLEVHVLAHFSERVNEDSEGDASKVEINKKGSIVFMLNPATTERELFFDQKSMVT